MLEEFPVDDIVLHNMYGAFEYLIFLVGPLDDSTFAVTSDITRIASLPVLSVHQVDQVVLRGDAIEQAVLDEFPFLNSLLACDWQ